jgi:hypothetical protein
MAVLLRRSEVARAAQRALGPRRVKRSAGSGAKPLSGRMAAGEELGVVTLDDECWEVDPCRRGETCR